MKRRNFIKTSFVAGSTLMIPGFLQALNKETVGQGNNKLIVIQLSGGNDGLNTFVPYRNDSYYNLRPNIGLSAKELIKCDSEMAFHQSLAQLANMFDNGEVNIINQVGYPNQNKSHFRASDIWLSASGANQYLQSGWLGRYLDAECTYPHAAIQYGVHKSLALKGKKGLGMVLTNPQQLYNFSNEPFLKALASSPASNKTDVGFLYKTLVNTQQSADYLYHTSRQYKSIVDYPKSKFGQSLKVIGSLMASGIQTNVFYNEIGGFDTHSNQLNRQKQLLLQLDEGLKALKDDLKASGNWNNTRILIFSEFGRRIKENGSKGTDHGKANNVWLIGGGLKKPGFYNSPSNLDMHSNNDLLHTVDFRSIYASVIHQWLKADYRSIIGRDHQPMDVL
ncbi:DUF1501 domain-containing protein [Carboxylicivirga sp. M1479]|uniref:DUF1501 domain-containing protein n=1 Tax=Carboxylicivirga sp. M1479 TaxID=2594476 RepID=UPI001177AEAD|nr:DUF1501 domain-containing protein [Carboxylicivirga sp. M1479]TRX72201.1 DUF1501 domain-containing protein [Carboxylicivirga sp. M1479]